MTPPQIAAARGRQTLVDGLIAAVLVTGIAPLAGAIQTASGWGDLLASWQTWTWAMFQAGSVAGVTAVVSWARRRFVDPASEAEAETPSEG